MQTRRRNFMVGSVATLAVAGGLVLGGARLEWPQVHAAGTQPIVVTAPVTAEQKSGAAIMPEQEVLSALYDQASASVVNIQVTISSPTQQEAPSQGSPFPCPFPFGQGNGQDCHNRPNRRKPKAAALSMTPKAIL